MIEKIFGLFVIFLAYAFYLWWFKPKRIMKKYAKQFRQLGYNVLEAPFNPLKFDMFATFIKGIKQGDALKYYKNQRSHYDVLISNVFTKPRIQIFHPNLHKQFFGVDKHYDYPKAQRIVQTFSRVGGKGLIFSQGKQWLRKRKILNKVFNFDFLKSQTEKIASICQKSFQRIEKKGKQNRIVQFNVSQLTVEVFSTIIMEIFLGGSKKQTINGKPAGEFVTKLMSDLNNQFINPINAFLGPKFTRLGVTSKQRQINSNIKLFNSWGIDFIRKKIKQIKINIENNLIQKPSDIIEALIFTKNEPNSEEQMQSETQIFQQFVTFYIAGTDTTSNFTQMMIYLVALHPEVEKKIRSEIQLFMKTEDYSYENLKNLTYIDSVQKQVTRYYGPGINMFSRVASKDNYFNNIHIRKDTNIGVIFVTSHYNQKYFKNPNQFRPQRWESECRQLPNFVLEGFGGGARTCIGKHLAMLQSKIALVKFMKRYKQIILPVKQIRMIYKFLYSPEQFKTKLVLN